MEEINDVLTTSAPKVLAVLDELVHTRSVFRATDNDPGPL